MSHPQHGKPTTLHVYKTLDNQLLGYVMRFDAPTGKTFCPYTYSAADGWQMKAFSKPRPLYGLERLRDHPTGARILVEGEKAADAAQRLAPSNACLSWCGGAGATKHADLSPLAGSSLILWPDADEPGRKAVADLATRLASMGCTLRIVDTTGLPEGFDAADLKEPLSTWLRPRLLPYTAIAAPEPVQAPSPAPAAPVARPAKPSASVTPITEARVKQQAKAQDEPIEYAEFAEDALANGFSERHPELRYVSRWSKWLEWTDLGWVEDTTLHIYDLTRLHCRACAAGNPNAALSSIRKVKSAATRASVENLARSDRRHAATAEQWDADPWLLNTPGGLVDLRTGAIRPVRLDDYCLRLTSATPIDKPIPRWLAFLDQTTGGDAQMIAYLRRLGGYAMTGDVREDFLGFIYGPGGNGKSVFMDTLQHVLGAYAVNAGMDTFTESKTGSHSEDVARLAGARLVIAQETEQGRRWNEQRVLALTGGGKITARRLYEASFEFQPQCKLVFSGNHKPALRNVGDNFRRRFNIIPFLRKPEVVDKELRSKLWDERDGILYWFLVGCIEWQCDGLQPPESVRAATSEYFENQDILGQWIIDCCEPGESTIRTLYKSYRTYCEGLHEFALRQGEFKDAITEAGPASKRPGTRRRLSSKGLRVRVSESHTIRPQRTLPRFGPNRRARPAVPALSRKPPAGRHAEDASPATACASAATSRC